MGRRILVTLAALAGVACATPGPSLAGLESLERSRFEAMMRQDVATLEPMLAEDLVYCHSDGTCERKHEFLETIGSGRIRYLAVKVLELRPRAYGDVVLFNGVLAIEGALGEQRRSFNVIFTDAWAYRDNRWQLVAWQSTPKP